MEGHALTAFSIFILFPFSLTVSFTAIILAFNALCGTPFMTYLQNRVITICDICDRVDSNHDFVRSDSGKQWFSCDSALVGHNIHKCTIPIDDDGKHAILSAVVAASGTCTLNKKLY